nr:peptide chain release factor N(5)-glutamine methyltransferase [Beduini massiliensis]
MTVRELIRQTEKQLEEQGKDIQVAKVWFYHLANKEPHELYLMMDEEVDESMATSFQDGISEYLKGRPIQYIKGVENFFGRDFIVNQDVLIPRYETEELVEHILYAIDDYFDDTDQIDLCDVGTGSGAIAVSLKCEEPRLKVWATDISEKALETAKTNAQNNDAKITFMQGDMVQPLIEAGIKVDIFVSNPPYIPVQQEIESVVKDHEPHVALFGGHDGLYFYRQIFNSVEAILKDKAILAFEMGYDQKEDMEKEVKHYFPDYPFEILKDINGKDRMLFIYKNISKK